MNHPSLEHRDLFHRGRNKATPRFIENTRMLRRNEERLLRLASRIGFEFAGSGPVAPALDGASLVAMQASRVRGEGDEVTEGFAHRDELYGRGSRDGGAVVIGGAMRA